MRPNWEGGISGVSRLVVALRRFGWASASISGVAAFAGTGGWIVKMRGCRRGCSPADKTVFEAVTDMSARVVCCFGLNRSSAAWRALLFPPRSSPAFGICELPDKGCSRKQWLKSSRDVRRLGELCKARSECATDLLDRLRTPDPK